MDCRDYLSIIGKALCENCASSFVRSNIKLSIADLYKQDYDFIFNTNHIYGETINKSQINNAMEYKKHLILAILDANGLSKQDIAKCETLIIAPLCENQKTFMINDFISNGIKIDYSK